METKVIHYCWFGNGKKNDLIKKCINSWKKYLPDYEIKEWNESNFDINQNEYIKEAYKQKKWAFVSDYARLWIIYNFGGIYMDTDVEIVKEFPKDLDNYNGFFCFEKDFINTGLGFGAQKNDLIIKQLLDSYNTIKFDPLRTCVMLNKSIFEKNFGLFKNVNEKKVINNYIFYSSEYFCPLDYVTREMNKTDNTIAIHWYGASWLTGKAKIINKVSNFMKSTIGNNNYEKIKKILVKKDEQV